MSTPAFEAESSEYQALLKAVADELKLPLIYIARQAELARLTNIPKDRALAEVEQSAGAALEFVDSYLLGLQLAESQQTLELEPVSVASVVYDVAERLEPLAHQRKVRLNLELGSPLGPVMAHRAGLGAALLNMGASVIEAQTVSANDKPPIVTIAAYRDRSGVVAGLYAPGLQVSATELRAARQLQGIARQPLKRFSAGPSAGIFVAQNILEAMAGRLRAARYHKQAGLAAVLIPSQQLRLV